MRRPASDFRRAALEPFTPSGRAVLALGAGALTAGLVTGLTELEVLGLMCLLLLAAAVPWLLVPMSVESSQSVHPPRPVAGDTVEVTLTARSDLRLPLWSPLVEVPLSGSSASAWVRLPTLRQGRTETATVPLRTTRRGLLVVGPPRARRSDPLGLLSRDVPWGDPTQLHVRPAMVSVPTLGAGLVSDLEGLPSDRISMSDLAFHALREYVRGDDLRHVHWRSSARAGELLVRQYQDTRRSHTTLVVDSAAGSYADAESDTPPGSDYELAASIAASLAMCAARDGSTVSLLSGVERIFGGTPGDVLDACCRMDPVEAAGDLAVDIAEAVRLAPSTSALLVITGSRSPDLRRLAGVLRLGSPDTRTVVIRAALGATTATSRQGALDVLTVGSLGDLPSLVAVGT